MLKHKVLFGSDYPWITPDRWLADFETALSKYYADKGSRALDPKLADTIKDKGAAFLARTEEGTNDARGLSLFAVPRSARVVVTKLEEKLGIHGSPTAVVNLDGAEGYLVGQRRRGLVTYVMSLIHGARLEVAAQAIGISQAALSATARYVRERRQFGHAIEDFAPVRQQLLEMEVAVQASRNLAYRAAQVLDRLHGVARMLARHPKDPRAASWAEEQRRLERVENVLTPLVKYWAAEAGNAACYRALQLHGGYGYVRDYGIERHVRDVRVTSLYEARARSRWEGSSPSSRPRGSRRSSPKSPRGERTPRRIPPSPRRSPRACSRRGRRRRSLAPTRPRRTSSS